MVDWAEAVCRGGQCLPLAAAGMSAGQVVIVSDASVLPPGTPAVIEIDWGWPDAFFCAGFAGRELAGAGREVVFIAGATVPAQRSLVDAAWHARRAAPVRCSSPECPAVIAGRGLG
jgi:hypothetical protein